jgi:cyclophilin family peptidyl-prolyl cis-trans isomerase
LNGKHTVFGKVVVGQDVVDSIQEGDKMEQVKISEK